MWDVRNMGCSGCGMFGMWDVRDVGYLLGYEMLLYKMSSNSIFFVQYIWHTQLKFRNWESVKGCAALIVRSLFYGTVIL